MGDGSKLTLVPTVEAGLMVNGWGGAPRGPALTGSPFPCERSPLPCQHSPHHTLDPFPSGPPTPPIKRGPPNPGARVRPQGLFFLSL